MIDFETAKLRSEIIKALAHPVRIMIIEYLKTGDKFFSEIFQLFALDKSTVSKHLNVLKQRGIVSSEKQGLDMLYKLEVKCITDFFMCVNVVMENNLKRQKRCLCKKNR